MQKFKYLIILALLFLLHPKVISAAEISVSVDAYKYDVKPDYIGINLSPDISSANYSNYIKSFNSSVISYPPSPLANYWDWQKGNISSNLKVLPKELKKYSAVTLSLDDYNSLLKASGTKPIFVLNMLTSDLNNQLLMLRKANKLGISITNIELGQEFYINNAAFLKKYPSIYTYVKEANLWKAAIKKEFPSARVAVVGALPTTNALPRTGLWNSIIAPSLSLNDVIAVNAYGAPGLFKDSFEVNEDDVYKAIINRKKLNIIDASTIFANAIRLSNKVSSDMKSIPGNSKVWVTEFNMLDKYDILNGKWIQGMYSGIMALELLEEERIDKLVYNPAVELVKNSRSDASELVFKQISTSIKGKTNFARLIFNNNPIINDSRNNESYFALMGYAFSNNNSKEVIILNLSSTNIKINIDMLLKNTTQTYVQYYGELMSNTIGTNGIKKNKNKCKGLLDLPPYSITRIL